MRPLAAILLLAMPLCAQRAQLARKGRQAETGRGAPAEPLRKLPRRGVTDGRNGDGIFEALCEGAVSFNLKILTACDSFCA